MDTVSAVATASQPGMTQRGPGPVAPEVAVLVPLEDSRGDVAEHLRTWTSAQSLARERYQVVLAADGRDAEGERRLETLLGRGDALVRAPGAGLIDLWNAAASGADAPWLVFTEAHCLADPGCLDALVRALETPRGTWAPVGSTTSTPNGTVTTGTT
jgi:hypothetical protein